MASHSEFVEKTRGRSFPCIFSYRYNFVLRRMAVLLEPSSQTGKAMAAPTVQSPARGALSRAGAERRVHRRCVLCII